MKFLRAAYEEMKRNFLCHQGFAVPAIYRSSFVHWGGGAEVQFIYRRFLRSLSPEARILVVGVMGGRDYFLLKNLRYQVVALDIGPQPEIDPIVFANVECRLPFEAETFDAVVIGEVLEHLKDDVNALENIRRVLKRAGTLIVSLPFYNDWEEGHMRIHSPESARRLLRMGGFEIEDYLERPGVVNLRFLNLLQHGISFLAYVLTRKTAYPHLTNLVGNFEWTTGHHVSFRLTRKLSSCFGGYFKCRPATETFDHVALNKRLYTSAPGLNPPV